MAGPLLALNLAQRAKAASAYRGLIRSSKFTFNSDIKTYRQFVFKAKELFTTKVLNLQYLLISYSGNEKSPTLGQPSEEEIVRRQFQVEIEGVLELSKYLTRNIVQGELLENGKRIALKFTNKTEIGDNSTIKNPQSITSNHSSSTCCSQAPPSESSSAPKLSQAALERREKRRLNRQSQLSSP